MRLARREKYFVSIAICTLALFLLLEFVLLPFFETRRRLQRGIKAKEEGLQEMVALSNTYRARKKAYREIALALSRRNKGFTLFSFLDRAAGEARVKDHVKYMKPSDSEGTGPYKESMVEMKLENITLTQLVDYLHRIESEKDLVSIKRISIKTNRKSSVYLDAVLQVITLKQT